MKTITNDWRIIYKCRRCDQKVTHNIGKEMDCVESVQNAAWDGHSITPISIRAISTHTCSDGATGVTDLIGAEEDKDQ